MAYYKPEELENVRKGLEWAKKNPTDPKSIEIQNRLKSGQLNFELRSLGLKEVPIKVSPITMQKQEEGLQSKVTDGVVKETGKDFLETASNLSSTISGGAQKMTSTLQSDTLTPAQKGMVVAGTMAGTGAKTVGDLTIGLGKMLLPQSVEDKIKSFVAEKASGISETKVVKDMVNWYENLPEDQKLIVDSSLGFSALVSEVVTGGTASTLSRPIKEGFKTAVETGIDLTKEGLKKADEFSVVNNANRVAKQEAKVDEAVARIIQGTPEDITKAKKALMEVETDGVKTYADLNTRLDDNIETLVKKQDAELAKYTEVYPKDQLARYKEVKGIDGKNTAVSDAPIVDALNQLDAYYSKVGDVSKSTVVKQYINKLNSTGLTVDEMNKIARMHGVDLNAYNANGELASGLTKQAAENTRQGVKETLRQRLPDEVSKGIDESLSNLYATRKLTQDMETKVQKLYQKVKNRTLAQKVGGAVADVVDLASFGTLRGFVQKLLPSNVGLKTANSLDLEKELSKNLKQVEKLLEMKEGPEFDTALKKLMEDTAPQSKLPDESFTQGEIPQTNGASVIQSRASTPEALKDIAKKINSSYEKVTPEHSSMIDEMFKKAPDADKFARTQGESLAKEYGAKFVAGPIKKRSKVETNLVFKYQGDISRIADVVRNTIVHPSKTQASKIYEKLLSNPNNKGKFVDSAQDPLGYTGWNVKVKAPNGLITETQINTPKMIFAKEAEKDARAQLGDELYESVKREMGGIEGGKGHKYYDAWFNAKNTGDFSTAEKIANESKVYYSQFYE